VIAETPSEGLGIDNRLSLGRGACGDWREQLTPVVKGLRIELSGSFPAACGERSLNLAPWAADRQVESLFRALWQELGGSFTGRVLEGRTPAAATMLLSQESPTLGEIVRDINKYSNNVMARQLFLTLDSERPATDRGRASAKSPAGCWPTICNCPNCSSTMAPACHARRASRPLAWRNSWTPPGEAR
jgi:D-alanyl-D-alanine carboxypeptidase/D-alanyl-D-alanine-endopeptidase (penicillin-binding protein 4)